MVVQTLQQSNNHHIKCVVSQLQPARPTLLAEGYPHGDPEYKWKIRLALKQQFHLINHIVNKISGPSIVRTDDSRRNATVSSEPDRNYCLIYAMTMARCITPRGTKQVNLQFPQPDWQRQALCRSSPLKASLAPHPEWRSAVWIRSSRTGNSWRRSASSPAACNSVTSLGVKLWRERGLSVQSIALWHDQSTEWQSVRGGGTAVWPAACTVVPWLVGRLAVVMSVR